VIRVAGGTYKPTTTTDRKLSFTLKSLISVHGGFAGIGAADPNRRDLAKYPTILSGDIGVVGDMNDNSMSVLFAGYVESTAILDGITITGGRSNGTGAGVYIAGSPTFLNCRFLGNSGGALQLSALNAASTPNIVNCVFAGNMSTRGGAVYIASATLATFTNCTFTANTATMSGGAIYGTSPTLVNCILWGNTAPVDPQIHPIGHAATVLYSDVQGGASGAANIDADPGFVRLPSSGFDSVWCTADDDYGDLRLTLSSPCIDAGSNLHVPSGTAGDVAGNTRLSDVVGVRDPGAIVDMGAYERVAPFADGAFPTDAPKPSVKITFNGDVLVSSLSSSDLMLVNCDTGAPIDCGAASVVSYDGAKRAATWQFLSVLPDGNYKATLPAGNVLDTNGGPIITTDLKFDFFVLAGDANRDRKVDINDLSILASNWNGSGKVFSQGDFNYDGKVDAKDLGILSTHWQQALPPPPATAPVSVTRAPTRTPVRMVSVVG
jgi:predicted outer membrane repeat protein